MEKLKEGFLKPNKYTEEKGIFTYEKMLFASLFTGLVLTISACGDSSSSEGGEVFKFGTQKNTDPKILPQIVKQLVEDQNGS